MKEKISLYGASGHAKVVIDIILSANHFVGDILDDDPTVKSLITYPVRTPELPTDYPLLITVGDNANRKKIAEAFKGPSAKAARQASAVLCITTTTEDGNRVMPKAVINAETRIGKHCIVNSGAVVEHDCILEDYVHISPNAAVAGGVKIGEGSHIGIGACIIPGIIIGKWCTIGAGAVIIKDVPDGATVVGNPGREV
jgi:acetyltransferase EpsM